MNRTFSFKRWAKLLVYENISSRFLRNTSLFIAIFATCYVILAKLHLLDYILYPNIPFSHVGTMLLTFISPIIFYHPLLKGDKKVLYSMLPASNFEKYLSMLVNTLVTAPLIVSTLCYIADWAAWPLLGSNEYYPPSFQLPLYEEYTTIGIQTLVTLIYVSHYSNKWKFTTGITILLIPFIFSALEQWTRIIFPKIAFYDTFIIYIILMQIIIYLKLKNITWNCKL